MKTIAAAMKKMTSMILVVALISGLMISAGFPIAGALSLDDDSTAMLMPLESMQTSFTDESFSADSIKGESLTPTSIELEFPSVTTPAADFTYTVLNGTYISVTGYTGDDAIIAVPGEIDGYIVQSIGNNSFQNKRDLQGVLLPDSIETIGSSTFYGCSGLEQIGLNSGLRVIGDNAFSGCTGLTSVTVPPSVATIQSSAFNGCTSLTEISLSEGLTNIGYNAFADCRHYKPTGSCSW